MKMLKSKIANNLLPTKKKAKIYNNKRVIYHAPIMCKTPRQIFTRKSEKQTTLLFKKTKTPSPSSVAPLLQRYPFSQTTFFSKSKTPPPSSSL